MSEINVRTIRDSRVLTLPDLIAVGNYNWFNGNITDTSIVPADTAGEMIGGDGRFETKFFEFEQGVSTDNVRRRIQNEDPSNPWSPARIKHLLAFGEKFPDRQGLYAVVAIGIDYRYFPYLFGGLKIRSPRYLGLEFRPDGTWRGDFTFLGVRRILKSRELP